MLLTGLRHSGRNLITPPICTCIKKFSYKVVKRPNFLNKPDTERKYVDKQLADKSIVLADHIRARIKLGGPITIADYMKEVLINPVSGYYMAKDVFGQHGDFITSPEIGQIFGEMIAIWCLTEWQKVGAPAPLQIVELGPGRGTLMQDILRVFAQLKLNKEFSLHLVEMSMFLSKSQAHLLCISNKEVQGMNHYREGETASGVKVRWYRQFNDIPDGFKILLAHEFFDALPIHKLLKDKDRWREMLIDIDPKNEKCFRYIQSKEETPVSKLFKTICNKDETREVVELSLEGDSILKIIANKFEEHGGIGLIMDYGHFGEKGDTFRAFKNHKLHDPLIDPGSADLTADVDFRAVQSACCAENRLVTYGPIEQGKFIKSIGGDIRLKVLLENANDEQKAVLQSGYDMLTSDEQMGARFKFFSMFPAVLKDHLMKYPVTGFS